jgi:AhpD family alkylhydroperoxidase
MPARITQPAFAVPGAIDALQALGAAVGNGGVPETTIPLVLMRASQINGCGVCLEGHVRHARAAGETDERLATIAAWRETPFFTDAERAALALTEAVTRLSDRSDPVPDALWTDAAAHYDEGQLATLVLAIANINVWNRLNVATAQVAGGAEW